MDINFEISKILEKIPVTKESMEAIQDDIQVKEIAKNEMFIRESEPVREFGYICKGLFRDFVSSDESEHTLFFRSEGQFLHSLTAFSENISARYSIQALEDSVILSIPIDIYEKNLNTFKCWQKLTEDKIMEVYRIKECRERSLLTDDAKMRFKVFAESYPHLINRVPQYIIASYLGVTPETLSRVKGAFPKKS